jgi:hypothetical protein
VVEHYRVKEGMADFHINFPHVEEKAKREVKLENCQET